MKNRIALLVFLFVLLLPTHTYAQHTPSRLFVPIGGGSTEIYTDLLGTVFARANLDQVKILALPIALTSNSGYITPLERDSILKAAEDQRDEIERACQQIIPPGKTCFITLAPILTRTDAENPAYLEYFPSDLAAIFILDGSQDVAMQLIAGTPIEKLLGEAYESGVVIAGIGAGAAMLSTTMLADSNLECGNNNSFMFGNADVWNSPEKRGLSSGFNNIIIDANIFEYGRFGRLLNAITLPESPHIGIGLQHATGLHVLDRNSLEAVFGKNTVTILDAESYHAAEGVKYIGTNHLISLRNVLVHSLSAGGFSYNLVTRQHSLGAYPSIQFRNFEPLKTPQGSGPLILAGRLLDPIIIQDSPNENPVLFEFSNLSGGKKANILIVSFSEQSAQKYQTALSVPTRIMVMSKEMTEPIVISPEITGIVLALDDLSQLQTSMFLPIKEAWLSGLPLLVDDAAASLAGKYYAANPQSWDNHTFQIEASDVLEGLNLLDAVIAPKSIRNFHWGFLFSLAYTHPDLLALGIPDQTAIKITSDSATVLGENVAVVLDLRNAQLAAGSNQGYVVANGLLDTYGPGESLIPITANVDAAPLEAPTPALPTATSAPPTPTLTSTSTLIPTLTPQPPTATSTRFSRVPPTRTPRPTSTPQAIPPPGDPDINNLMIILAVVIVIVIIIGLWVNRRRII